MWFVLLLILFRAQFYINIYGKKEAFWKGTPIYGIVEHKSIRNRAAKNIVSYTLQPISKLLIVFQVVQNQKPTNLYQDPWFHDRDFKGVFPVLKQTESWLIQWDTPLCLVLWLKRAVKVSFLFKHSNKNEIPKLRAFFTIVGNKRIVYGTYNNPL